MPKYKKCPRCELNYILENEDYCEICKQELRGQRPTTEFDDINLEDEELGLCPKCHKNYLNEGEKICEACAQSNRLTSFAELEEAEEPDVDEELETSEETADDDWELSLEGMQDEEFDEEMSDDIDEDEAGDVDEEEEEETEDDFDEDEDIETEDEDEDEDENEDDLE